MLGMAERKGLGSDDAVELMTILGPSAFFQKEINLWF